MQLLALYNTYITKLNGAVMVSQEKTQDSRRDRKENNARQGDLGFSGKIRPIATGFFAKQTQSVKKSNECKPNYYKGL
jgi:hypothetical protein